MWAGQTTTLIKRDDFGFCRGYAFLSFYSVEGANVVVDRVNSGYINDNGNVNSNIDTKLPSQLQAELSNPKAGKDKKKASKNQKQEHYSDIRLRSKRKAPIKKHPVITSSDGSKTNLGNKNR